MILLIDAHFFVRVAIGFCLAVLLYELCMWMYRRRTEPTEAHLAQTRDRGMAQAKGAILGFAVLLLLAFVVYMLVG